MKYPSINIVFSNKKYLIVNKSAGVLCQPPDMNTWYKKHDYDPPILIKMLQSNAYSNDFPSTEEWRNIQRLDECVTGGVLIALSKEAAKMFSLNLKKGGNKGYRIERKYVAILNDSKQLHMPDEGIITNNGMVSFYKKLSDNLIVLQLITGKKHQIRIQMSQILKQPIINDVKYGSPAVPNMINNIALHSAMIKTKIGLKQQTHLVNIPQESLSLWQKYVRPDGSFIDPILQVLYEDWGDKIRKITQSYLSYNR